MHMSPIISGVTRQKFTKFLHDIAKSSPLLTHTFIQSFLSDSAKNASGISRAAFMTFSQNQLIAMATSLDKSKKNEVQFYDLHPKRFVERS